MAAPKKTESEEKEEKSKPVDYSKYFSLNEVKHQTGILPLDTVLGGGYERGDFIEVSSESGVGKSTILANLVKNALAVESDHKCRAAYLDVERGMHSSMLKNMSILDKLSDQPGDPFVMYKPHSFALVDSMFYDLIVVHKYEHVILDSITQLVPSKIMESNIEDVTIGVDARMQSLLIKKYKSACRESGTTVWVVSQRRTKMETIGAGRFAKMKVTTESAGGKAMQFGPDIRLEMVKGAMLKREERTVNGNEEVVYGNEARIKCVKNRAERPEIFVPITIIFGYGASNVAFIKDVMKTNGMYTVGGAGYFSIDWNGETISKRGIVELDRWVKDNFDALRTHMQSKNMFALTQGVVS